MSLMPNIQQNAALASLGTPSFGGNTNKTNDNGFAAMLAEQTTKTQKTASSAPAAGNNGSSGKGASDSDASQKAAKQAEANKKAIDDFLKFARMTPAEKFRAQFLAAHHLTEEDLAKMSPADRQKIEDQIRKEIQKKLKQQLGGMASAAASGINV